MITITILLFTFALVFRYRRKRLAAERKRQIVQTWPRAVAAFIGPVSEHDQGQNHASEEPTSPQTEYRYSVS